MPNYVNQGIRQYFIPAKTRRSTHMYNTKYQPKRLYDLNWCIVLLVVTLTH